MGKIFETFYDNVRSCPNKVAVYCEDKTMTYSELASLIDKLSAILVKHNVKYHDHLGVLLPNNINFIALIFAAAKLGVAIVPLSPTLPPMAIDKAFRYANVKHIIGTEYSLENLNKEDMPYIDELWLNMEGRLEGVINFIDEQIERHEGYLNYTEIIGDEPLILTMTSGSTGSPKPITLTQNNKYDRAFATKELYNVTENDVVLAATPLYHSLAQRLVILPLLLGATAVLLPRFTPMLWLNCIKNHSVTFTIAVSSQLNQLVDDSISPFLQEIISLRCLVSSSALMEDHIKTALASKLNCELCECYGTSEIAIATSINITESKEKYKSVGRATPNVDIKILKSDGTFANAGEKGEIICKTPLLFAGYYNLPEVTQNAMKDEYFCTGDIGVMDEQSYLYFVDRKKDLIITGGINVYPNDIESAILQLSSVKECIAFAYPDKRLGEIVAVAVVPKTVEINLREVKIHCANVLGDFQQPMKYFIVEEIPKNDMGKMVKHELVKKLTII